MCPSFFFFASRYLRVSFEGALPETQFVDQVLRAVDTNGEPQ